MELRVLGPLEVSGGNGPLSLGGRQQQLVLGLLVAHLNQVVSTDRFIDEIWGASPPGTARKAVQSYAAQLRTVINRDAEILKGRAGGYVLELEAKRVDAYRFEALAHEGRSRLASDPPGAAQILREALALWRGSAYGDLAHETPSLREEVARLSEVRLGALEARLEADLRTGEDVSIVLELEHTVAAHPYRERLRSLLILALYRAGRQADALRAYQEARGTLAEDLGLELSPELRRLEQAVLDQDPLLRSEDPLTALAAAEAPRVRRNPYKGLRPFGEEDVEDFFGRTDLIRRLTERLSRRDVTGRLLVVAGPSGSGKSSLVGAGLIPLLRGGAVSGSETWRVETVYPGQDPLRALGSAAGPQDEDLPVALVQPLLVVIDQFEEVFTLSDDDRARQTLFRWIAGAVTSEARDLRLLVIIRADFLDHLLEYEELARLIQPCLELIPPLAEQEVRAVVTEPAARVGVVVDAELVAEIARDAAARPGALPLLQYALTELFERRSGDRLTIDAYRAAAGISGALARRAEDLYGGLDERRRLALRQALLRLVILTDEGEYLKRRVATAELAQLSLDQDALEEVLERFGHHRFLTFDRDHTGQPTVEVAHEALLREWPRLRNWIEEAREGLLLQRRLGSALAEWRDSQEDPSYLLGGGRLEQFEEWAAGTDLAMTDDERQFLTASRDFENRRRLRQHVQRWSLVGVLVIAVILVSGLALFIRERERIATARELAVASGVEAAADPQLSLLLALEGMRTGPDTREVVEALHRAVTQSRELWRATWPEDLPSAQTLGVDISPDDSLVATSGDGATALLLDRETGDLIRVLEPEPGYDSKAEIGIPEVSFSPDGQLLASFASDGVVRIWAVHTGALVTRLIHSDRSGPPGKVLFGPNGKWLYSGTSSRIGVQLTSLPSWVIQWSVDTWQEERRWDLDVAEVSLGGLVVSADGSLLVVPSHPEEMVFLFDTGTGAEVNRIETGEDRPPVSVSLSPDGSLAIGSDDILTLWDPLSGEQLGELPYPGSVVALGFDARGRLAAGTFQQHYAEVLDLAPLDFGDEPRALRLLHNGLVGGLDFDSTGETMVTGSTDGTVRLWDVTPGGRGEITTVSTRFAYDVQFYSDGARMAVATHADHHGMQLIDLTSGEQLRAPAAYSARVAFTSDESLFAAQIADLDDEGRQIIESGIPLWEPAIGIWETRTGELIAELPASDQACQGGAPGGFPAFSRDDRHLAVGYPCEEIVRIWQLPEGQLVAEINNGARVDDVAWGPDDQYLVTVSSDAVLRIWEADSWQPADQVPAGNFVNSITFSSDGQLAGTISADGIVRLWRAEDWSLLHTLVGHTGPVGRVAFSPDERHVATAGGDAVIRIWDVETGEELWKLEGHNEPVFAVAFHPNGVHIASIPIPRTSQPMWIWTLNPGELIEIAQARVTRSLTDQECQTYLHRDACPSD